MHYTGYFSMRHYAGFSQIGSHICMCVYEYVCVCMYVGVCIQVYVCMCVCACMHVCVCMCVTVCVHSKNDYSGLA